MFCVWTKQFSLSSTVTEDAVGRTIPYQPSGRVQCVRARHKQGKSREGKGLFYFCAYAFGDYYFIIACASRRDDVCCFFCCVCAAKRRMQAGKGVLLLSAPLSSFLSFVATVGQLLVKCWGFFACIFFNKKKKLFS